MEQYCPNRNCSSRRITNGPLEVCPTCSTPLVLNERYRLLYPLSKAKSRKATEVFVAYDIKEDKKIVLKSLRTSNEKLITMYMREVYVVQYVVHPNKPNSDLRSEFSVEIDDRLHRMLVMDLVEGISLKQWLKDHVLTTDSQIIDWLKQLVSVLDSVHEFGFFHRDVNPNNIIVRPDNQLSLIDFGACRDQSDTYLNKVSKGLEEDDDNEVTSIFTIDFAPREQVYGRALPQSDFFSLGLTLINCITGKNPSRLPVDEDTGKHKWRHLATGISDEICDYIDRLCHPIPAKRPHSTEIILKQIEDLPAKVRRGRIVRSPLVQFGLVLTGVAAISLLSYFGSRAMAQYEVTLGNSDYSQERYQEAKSHFESSLGWNPSSEAYRSLVNVCARIGDDPCLEKSYRDAIQFDPGNIDIRFRLGAYYEDIRNYDLAVKLYSEAIQVNPDDSSFAKNNLARLKILEGDYQDALELISKAIDEELSKESPKGYLVSTLFKNRGWALLELGDRSGAEESLLKALEYDGLEVSANCLLGSIFDKRKYWSICFSQISQLPEVQIWREEFLQRTTKD